MAINFSRSACRNPRVQTVDQWELLLDKQYAGKPQKLPAINYPGDGRPHVYFDEGKAYVMILPNKLGGGKYEDDLYITMVVAPMFQPTTLQYLHRIQPLLPKGWSAFTVDDRVTITRDQDIRGSSNGPSQPGMLPGEDRFPPRPLVIFVRVGSLITPAQRQTLANENEAALKQWYVDHPQNPSAKPSAPPRKHDLPNHFDATHSVWLFNSADMWTFEDKNVEKECRGVYGSIEALFQDYETAATATAPATGPTAAAVRPAEELDALAAMLTKEVGGKWEMGEHSGFARATKIVRGSIVSAPGKALADYDVFPFGSQDPRRTQVIEMYGKLPTARILGANDQFIVVELAVGDASAPSAKLMKVLSLNPPGAAASTPGRPMGEVAGETLERLRGELAGLGKEFPMLAEAGKVEIKKEGDEVSLRLENNATSQSKFGPVKAVDPAKPFCLVYMSVAPPPAMIPRAMVARAEISLKASGKSRGTCCALGESGWFATIVVETDDEKLAERVNGLMNGQLRRLLGAAQGPAQPTGANSPAPTTAAAMSQEQVVAEIEKLGGKFKREGNVPDGAVVEISFGLGSSQGGTATDALLEHLKGMNQLRTLYLPATAVTDAGLEHLTGLDKLQTLDLSFTVVSDAGLKHLAGLLQLQALNLTGTKVTDPGVKKLQGALPKCKVTTTPLAPPVGPPASQPATAPAVSAVGPLISTSQSPEKLAEMRATLRAIRVQLERYQLDHGGAAPTFASLTDGWQPLLAKTDAQGHITPAGKFGPYLQTPPLNPFNGSAAVAPAGQPIHAGWTYDQSTMTLRAVLPELLPANAPASDADFERITPRMLDLAGKVGASLSALQTLHSNIALWGIQHGDHLPTLAQMQDEWKVFTAKTERDGRIVATGTLGPYLASAPRSPFNGSSKVAAVGHPTADAGWTYDPDTGKLRVIVPHEDGAIVQWAMRPEVPEVAPAAATAPATQASAKTVERRKLLEDHLASLDFDFIGQGKLSDKNFPARLRLTRSDISGERGKWPWSLSAQLSEKEAGRLVAAMADAGWLDAAKPHNPAGNLGPEKYPGYLVLFGVQVNNEWRSFTLDFGWGPALFEKVRPFDQALSEKTQARAAWDSFLAQAKDRGGQTAQPAPPQSFVRAVRAVQQTPRPLRSRPAQSLVRAPRGSARDRRRQRRDVLLRPQQRCFLSALPCRGHCSIQLLRPHCQCRHHRGTPRPGSAGRRFRLRPRHARSRDPPGRSYMAADHGAA